MTVHHDARVVQFSDRRTPTRPELPEPMPTPWESVCRLAAALRAFGRELRTYAGVWLSAHRLGYVERAHAAGYVEGYCDGVSASPSRSA